MSYKCKSALGGGSAYSAISASPAYFWRGQKKPRRPSPLVRGTTCTCTCGTAWLTMLFSAIHEPWAPSAVDDRSRAALHRDEQLRKERLGELGQRHDVLARHHEHVTFEDRPVVEERDDLGLVEHDVGRRGTGDDRTEEAIVAGHAGKFWLGGGLAVSRAVQEAYADVRHRHGHQRTDVAQR